MRRLETTYSTLVWAADGSRLTKSRPPSATALPGDPIGPKYPHELADAEIDAILDELIDRLCGGASGQS